MNIEDLMHNVTPTLGPFGTALGPKMTMILGLVWLLCMLGSVALLMRGGLEFAGSRQAGRAMAAADGVMDIGVPAMALIFLGIIPAIVQALL